MRADAAKHAISWLELHTVRVHPGRHQHTPVMQFHRAAVRAKQLLPTLLLGSASITTPATSPPGICHKGGFGRQGRWTVMSQPASKSLSTVSAGCCSDCMDRLTFGRVTMKRGTSPLRVFQSMGLTDAAMIWMRTSVRRRFGLGKSVSSCRLDGGPNRRKTAACMLRSR